MVNARRQRSSSRRSSAVNVNFMHMSGIEPAPRPQHQRAAGDGVRPDPALGNVTQVESTARMRGDTLNTGLNINVPARRMMIFANYSFVDQQERRRRSVQPAGRQLRPGGANGGRRPASRAISPARSSTRTLPDRTSGSASPRPRERARRYNVTTGRDDNGDTVFNDRPPGVGRNSAVGKGMWDVAARVSYAFGFGERSAAGRAGGPTMIMQRVGGGGERRRSARRRWAAAARRTSASASSCSSSAQNLLNSVNPIGYLGRDDVARSSPQPTAAMPGRRIDLGMRVGF